MRAPVIRIGMTPEELAEQLVELYADIYAAGDRQTKTPRMLYLVHGKHLGAFPAPDKNQLYEACESAAAHGVDLLVVCSVGWAIEVKSSMAEALEERHKVMNDLSLHPDRREVLTITVASPTGQWRITSIIDRSGDKVRLEAVRGVQDGAALDFFSDLPWVAS